MPHLFHLLDTSLIIAHNMSFLPPPAYPGRPCDSVESVMDCPELKNILANLEDNVIPDNVHFRLEEHCSTCHACKSGMSNFLQVGKILEKTVYGESGKDDILRYICHISGKNYRWAAPEKKPNSVKKRISFDCLLKSAPAFSQPRDWEPAWR